MTDRKLIGGKAEAFFDDLWRRGDPWALESSPFERQKYARQLAMLGDRRYGRVLEVGCGAGAFTRLLAGVADEILALDVAPAAIERAGRLLPDQAAIDFRVANVMDHDAWSGGPWDLIVFAETIYYLGWLYTFFDVAWLASELFAATKAGGRLLLANTEGELEDYLVRPWLIRTYRDLFLNVGFSLEAEETFRGTKDGVELDVLISRFGKAADG